VPLKPGTTIGEAREAIQKFLSSTGCYDICAQCPVYPNGVGCCHGCAKLARSVSGEVLGCSQPNLSCLSYTCSVLDRHLLEIGKFEEFNGLVYGIPREGYRGCEPRPGGEVIQIKDPIREIRAVIGVKPLYQEAE
jgi:hypothetical protein